MLQVAECEKPKIGPLVPNNFYFQKVASYWRRTRSPSQWSEVIMKSAAPIQSVLRRAEWTQSFFSLQIRIQINKGSWPATSVHIFP